MSKQIKNSDYVVIIVFFLGFALRFTLAHLYYGYPNDIACFKSWAYMLFSNGLSNFYSSPEFTDYPPGYMYILYLLGALRHLFNIPPQSQVFTLIIKLPAIIFDMATAIFIYSFTSKTTTKKSFAIVTSALYLFNPAIIINSAVWGQVDSVYTFVIMLSIYCLYPQTKTFSKNNSGVSVEINRHPERKMNSFSLASVTRTSLFKGFLLFTCAILIKPQSLIFSPVYLFYLYDVLKKNHFNRDTILYILKSGLVCVLALFFAMLPFTKDFDFMPIIEQYVRTLASYPYASVNAYNLYTAMGANWLPVDETFLFLSYSSWGYIFIVLIVLCSFYLLKRHTEVFFTAALINFATFMLSAKMHERYVFPAITLFLISFIKSGSKYVLFLYIALSGTLFVNCVDILRLVDNGNNIDLIAKSSLIVSLINICLFIYAIAITKERTKYEY